MRATTKVCPLPVTLLLFGFSLLISAQSNTVWPEYNQQCRDDSGPPFLDDEDTFPNGGKYHDDSAAVPILQNGKCAPKMQNACRDRPTVIGAYLEGPIDCGDQGWYCRIFVEDGWDNVALRNDYNFGHCNTTENFDDAGRDQDGHCHGSSHDNTYYWWIRDHWHRQYNGRLRCCCGWYTNTSTPEISPEPLYNRRIANRCDYRRLVTPEENINNCRDANEEHGLGFDDIGCDPKFSNQIDAPIPEDDSKCWEVSKFGYADTDATRAPTPASAAPSRNKDTNPTLSPMEEPPEEDCTEDPEAKFIVKRKGKNNLKKKCKWLMNRNDKKKKNYCRKKKGTNKLDPPKVSCRITCEICDPEEDDDEYEDGDSGDEINVFD